MRIRSRSLHSCKTFLENTGCSTHLDTLTCIILTLWISAAWPEPLGWLRHGSGRAWRPYGGANAGDGTDALGLRIKQPMETSLLQRHARISDGSRYKSLSLLNPTNEGKYENRLRAALPSAWLWPQLFQILFDVDELLLKVTIKEVGTVDRKDAVSRNHLRKMWQALSTSEAV